MSHNFGLAMSERIHIRNSYEFALPVIESGVRIYDIGVSISPYDNGIKIWPREYGGMRRAERQGLVGRLPWRPLLRRAENENTHTRRERLRRTKSKRRGPALYRVWGGGDRIMGPMYRTPFPVSLHAVDAILPGSYVRHDRRT